MESRKLKVLLVDDNAGFIVSLVSSLGESFLLPSRRRKIEEMVAGSEEAFGALVSEIAYWQSPENQNLVLDDVEENLVKDGHFSLEGFQSCILGMGASLEGSGQSLNISLIQKDYPRCYGIYEAIRQELPIDVQVRTDLISGLQEVETRHDYDLAVIDFWFEGMGEEDRGPDRSLLGGYLVALVAEAYRRELKPFRVYIYSGARVRRAMVDTLDRAYVEQVIRKRLSSTAVVADSNRDRFRDLEAQKETVANELIHMYKEISREYINAASYSDLSKFYKLVIELPSESDLKSKNKLKSSARRLAELLETAPNYSLTFQNLEFKIPFESLFSALLVQCERAKECFTEYGDVSNDIVDDFLWEREQTLSLLRDRLLQYKMNQLKGFWDDQAIGGMKINQLLHLSYFWWFHKPLKFNNLSCSGWVLSN